VRSPVAGVSAGVPAELAQQSSYQPAPPHPDPDLDPCPDPGPGSGPGPGPGPGLNPDWCRRQQT